jgi:polyferredoxin
LWLDPLALLSGVFSVVHRSSMAAGLSSAAAIAIILLLSFVWPGIWCSHICPLGATQDGLKWTGNLFRGLVTRNKPAANEQVRRGLPRRTILGAAVSAAVGFRLASTVRTGLASVAPPLRPPNALDETRLAGACVRCGNCLRACPADIIRMDLKL